MAFLSACSASTASLTYFFKTGCGFYLYSTPGWITRYARMCSTGYTATWTMGRKRLFLRTANARPGLTTITATTRYTKITRAAISLQQRAVTSGLAANRRTCRKTVASPSCSSLSILNITHLISFIKDACTAMPAVIFCAARRSYGRALAL